MSRDITDGLQTIWTVVKGSTWYTGLTLSAPSEMPDLRPKYAAGDGYITYAAATALIEGALRRGVRNPRLVTAFGEGLRGSVAHPGPVALASVDGLMQAAGWIFNPDWSNPMTGAAVSFGSLAETGLRPLAANAGQCAQAFYALLYIAYAVGGMTYRIDTTQDEAGIFIPGGNSVLASQRASMAGAAVRGHPGTGGLAAAAGGMAGEGTVTS